MTYLLTVSGLTTLVSNRIYAEEMDVKINNKISDIFPAVIYSKISDVKSATLTAQMKLERPSFQFSSIALRKSVARAISNQIRNALVDYQGTLSGLVIQKIELQNEDSLKEQSTDGTVQVYTETLEFQINFERS